MTAPKILIIDIETKPNVAHVWGLWKNDVSLTQLRQPGSVIAFAAKWVGKRAVEFRSDYHDGHAVMVERAHELMDEADFVVHYNGTSFDMPWLRTEFVQAGLLPPSPHKDIDLCSIVKKTFRFPSNKLAYVTVALGLSGKLAHTGHQMWVDIMEGDEDTQRKAWNLMRRYNKQDVVTTEELFNRLTPWIRILPNPALFTNDSGVPEACGCGSSDLQKRGFFYTTVSAYQRFRCNGCGRWLRGAKRERGVALRGV
ncbi:MAG TPA: ribonuclease H-like domain-containing protein [Nocardioidaceae bacterium]|nr:ribonuclease H-like domain-containing protein [Nocardioidaceae bacterium]